MIKKWTKLTLIALSLISVVGCTNKKTDQSNYYSGNGRYAQNEAGAQTSGLGSESQFQGEDLAREGSRTAARTFYFDFDRDTVRDEYRPAILANADYLVTHPRAQIVLEGHTDPRGSREYNIGLGERRAKAVYSILAAKGVKPSQIRVVSYGAEKLAVAGRSEEDYQKDRRAIIVFAQS